MIRIIERMISAAKLVVASGAAFFLRRRALRPLESTARKTAKAV